MAYVSGLPSFEKSQMLGMEYSLQDLEDSKEPDLSIFKNVRLSKL